MQYLLHIDTAGDTGVVALSGNGAIIASRINEESRNHASSINLMIEDLLADTGISFEELAGIAVCGGPGSYTGLRIGLSTAKGLCYALDKPLILDNRLTLLAFQAYQKHQNTYTQYLTLLTARDKEYFISIHDNNFSCTLSPKHIIEEELDKLIKKTEKTYLVTNAPTDVIPALNLTGTHIDTEIKTDLNSWGFYAFEQFKCNIIVNLSASEPFYLKQVYTHK